MARLEFRMPDIGEGLAEVEIVQWLVGVGDAVAENQPIADVETDKSIVTMPAPATGAIAEFLAQPGERVKVGSVLLVLEVPDAAGAMTANRSEPDNGDSAVMRAPASEPARRTAPVQAAPAVRKLASELGVDLDNVRGTGPAGRVLAADVEMHAMRARAPEPASEPDVVERVPVRGLRRRIAEAMTQSARAIPHVCGFHELDAEVLVAAHRRLKPAAAANGVRLTYLAFFVKATAATLVEHPLLNATYDEEEPAIVLKKERNIGIATATPDGLLVPVIRNADRLELFAVAREAERLAVGARARALEPSDLQHGTFTISNVGGANGWFGTSIIRYPEAAILGIGRIEPRPVARDGAVVVRPIVPLSLTFDHRVIDGDAALAFVLTLRRYIERSDSPLYQHA
jgi:pyruvate dehydrogenase E2 component (dihydrolipoamide acetyltransferase)